MEIGVAGALPPVASRTRDDALVFPGPHGKPWSLTDYQNWRRRIYAPTAQACGVEHPRPYYLRHSFVSLLIQEGLSVVEVAPQAGHAPTMTLATCTASRTHVGRLAAGTDSSCLQGPA
jgi:integrase